MVAEGRLDTLFILDDCKLVKDVYIYKQDVI